MALKFSTENSKGNNSPEGLHLLTSNSNQISFLRHKDAVEWIKSRASTAYDKEEQWWRRGSGSVMQA